MVYDLIFMSLITVQNLTNECFRTLLNRFGSNQVWTGLVWSGQQELGQHAKRFVRMLKIWPKDGPGMPMSKWQKMSPGRKWDKMSTGTKYRWEKMFPNHFCHRKIKFDTTRKISRCGEQIARFSIGFGASECFSDAITL